MSKYSSSKISETTVSQTDWKRLDEAEDIDIDLSECPEMTPEMFARAVVRFVGVYNRFTQKNKSLCILTRMFWPGGVLKAMGTRPVSMRCYEPIWKNQNTTVPLHPNDGSSLE